MLVCNSDADKTTLFVAIAAAMSAIMAFTWLYSIFPVCLFSFFCSATLNKTKTKHTQTHIYIHFIIFVVVVFVAGCVVYSIDRPNRVYGKQKNLLENVLNAEIIHTYIDKIQKNWYIHNVFPHPMLLTRIKN